MVHLHAAHHPGRIWIVLPFALDLGRSTREPGGSCERHLEASVGAARLKIVGVLG